MSDRTDSVESYLLEAKDGFPNNRYLPLLVYRQAISTDEPDAARTFERLFSVNGWRGSWRNGVYSFHHFHSNAHEVLGVYGGSAQLQFGGPDGPVIKVETGDVVILPAGTGHKQISAASDFHVVGAYPAGQEDYDVMRGDPQERSEAEKRIAGVPLPQSDPIYGAEGPLSAYWGDRQA